MHTRRSFLQRLATGILATALAVELGAKKPRPEIIEPSKVEYRINPAWVNAPYECQTVLTQSDLERIYREHFYPDPYPARFELVNGEYVQVNPFIAAQV